ncbi:hypothetical protein [Nonomuraea aridisoli]|uniref:hypothetical protein n=1 Tax=Nonomuraea aridisoli TaxID=2070368 RepID=UPI0015E8C037|nr:hypothetical protein [Nonomuraea aridisoli]
MLLGHAGRQVDRRGPDTVNLVCLIVVIASSPVLAAGGLGGTPGLVGLVMACAYAGGAAGSWLGTVAYGQAGWPAVCALVAVLAALALARHLMTVYGRENREDDPTGTRTAKVVRGTGDEGVPTVR